MAAHRRTTTAATCRPGPSSERPNNILAPFWTDLDGTGAPGVLVNVLTDGVGTWLVVEWRVNVFGTNDTRVFQTWIGVDGTQDIAFAYADLDDRPDGQDYLVGAENAAGDGDVSRFLPAEDQRSHLDQPDAGRHGHLHGDGARDDGRRGQRAHRPDRDGGEGRHDG